MLKWFGKDICCLPLGWYMDHIYVASLMVISQEVELDVYVFGSGVEHWVLCNANRRHIVYKDGNPTKAQPIILQSLFHPKNLRAAAMYSASVEESATLACLRDDHKTSDVPRK